MPSSPGTDTVVAVVRIDVRRGLARVDAVAFDTGSAWRAQLPQPRNNDGRVRRIDITREQWIRTRHPM